MKHAPVALFAFNRADHLKKTIHALSRNGGAKETDVHVFVDGPRNETDRVAQEEISHILNSEVKNSFQSLSVVHSPVNKGLAKSIIDGVSETVKKHGAVIVLEDDLVTSPHFLRYMNDALEKYASEERVISIHGYVNPVEVGSEPFFLKGADCWGWATWERGWKLFEKDGSKLLKELKERRVEKEFNFGNNYDYVGMLQDQIAGRNNSWAVRWYASAFLLNRLTLYPHVSLVKNIGFDGSGTHGDDSSEYDVKLASEAITSFPIRVEESSMGYAAYCRFYGSVKAGFFRRFFGKIKRAMLG